MSLLDYFRVRPLKPTGAIDDDLWTPGAEELLGDAHTETLMAQYALYVEMADRISQRRGQANTFYLSVHTGVFVLLAGWLQGTGQDLPAYAAIILAAALVVACLAWFWTIRSYRQLNSAKWNIVGLIEKRLAIRPWGAAEWTALGEGKDPSRYWPLTRVETVVPLLFALGYIAALVAYLST